MKILIAFYSRTLITKSIAEQIYELLENEHQIELLQLSEKRKYHFLKLTIAPTKSGSYSIVLGSTRLFLDTIFKKTPRLENILIDVQKFDLLIIGSPIWYGRLPPAINTFISNLKNIAPNKKTLIFVTSGVGKNYKKYPDLLKNELENIGLDVILKIHIDTVKASYLIKEHKKLILESIRSTF